MVQIEHRRSLVSYWDTKPGSRVLEIGCGQGGTTVVLVDTVGENGHVDAVDPGALDYAQSSTLFSCITAQTFPITQSLAQFPSRLSVHPHIKSNPLGSRIIFHAPVNPLDHLANLPASPKLHYTYAILSHSIFYFSSPSILPTLISALKPHCQTICIAEWSLTSSSPSAFPHVLPARLRSLLEAKRGVESRGNIRTVLSPAQIKSIVTGDRDGEVRGTSGKGGGQDEERRFALKRENVLSALTGMRDAYWEARDIVMAREGEIRLLKENKTSDRELNAVEAMFDSIELALDGLKGGVQSVECMDVLGWSF